MIELKDLPPRSYSDVAVPDGPNGKPMLRASGEPEFTIYTDWLVDYLHENEIPVHPRQESYARVMDEKEPETAISCISESYGAAVFLLEDCLEAAFESGETWADYDRFQANVWNQYMADAVDPIEETYEEFALDQETWCRLRDEWREAKAVPVLPDYSDIPFRSLLSRCLKRMHEKTRRRSVIQYFFLNIMEVASK